MADKNERRFCMLLVPSASEGKTKAALLDEFKWQPGTQIKVRFVEGDPALQERVRTVATERTGPNMANLKLQFVTHGDADIRVAFREGNGSWSYLGTACHRIPASQPTMNYGWLTPDSADKEYSRVVLHEFGHALGAIHEHQSPDVRIPWDTEAVYAYYARQGWSRSQVDSNLFRAYSPEGIQFSRFDAQSIMLYAVDNALTEGDWEVGWNTRLSEQDRALIASQYPPETDPTP